MNHIRNHLKTTYNLSNYQIAQLVFLFKTLSSELSKILIMGIFFHKQLSFYIFALFIMLALRCTSGGLHFYTYVRCLTASIVYLWLAITALPHILLSRQIRILLLLLSLAVCCKTGPVTSKYRPTPTPQNIQKWRTASCAFIFLYTSLMYIMPENTYMNVGFWVIILHSLQLIIAKIWTKGGDAN